MGCVCLHPSVITSRTQVLNPSFQSFSGLDKRCNIRQWKESGTLLEYRSPGDFLPSRTLASSWIKWGKVPPTPPSSQSTLFGLCLATSQNLNLMATPPPFSSQIIVFEEFKPGLEIQFTNISRLGMIFRRVNLQHLSQSFWVFLAELEIKKSECTISQELEHFLTAFAW